MSVVAYCKQYGTTRDWQPGKWVPHNNYIYDRRHEKFTKHIRLPQLLGGYGSLFSMHAALSLSYLNFISLYHSKIIHLLLFT